MKERHDRTWNGGVLIIVENLPVPPDRRVWQEATALKEAGYVVSVICPKGKGYIATYEKIDGVHIYRHSLPLEGSTAIGYLVEYSFALFWWLALSLKVLGRHGFDVIHACNPPDLIFLVGQFYKILLGKKFVFDHHDICPELYEAKTGRRGFFHKLLLYLERGTFACADASLATNDTFKKIAVDRGGMTPDRVWVVRSYPDLAHFRRVTPDLSLRNGRTYLVGYVGVIAKQDGVDCLLRAMHRIVYEDGREDVQCLIIGDGPEHANLFTLAKTLDLQDFVSFVGYLSGDDLLRHLSSIDLGVIPDPCNAYNDKISMNKVFEYMAFGIPFVQFDLTESRRTAGDAGLIVRDHSATGLADAILELLDDPGKRQTMSAYGAARAKSEFQWESEKRNLLAAYRTLFP